MSEPLARYPRPSVAVDLAVLSVRPSRSSPPGRLVTLVQERTDSPAGPVLPGRFIRERRTIQQTVEELLAEKVGLSPTRVAPRLLRVFDDPRRDERGWALSIGHGVAVPWEEAAQARGTWVSVSRRGSAHRTKLLFGHDEILLAAVIAMRNRYELHPDPDHLFRQPFSLLELRRLHEAVLGSELRKDTFSRRMRKQLQESGEVALTAALDSGPSSLSTHGSRPVGRPAQLYLHEPRRDAAADALWRLPREVRSR